MIKNNDNSFIIKLRYNKKRIIITRYLLFLLLKKLKNKKLFSLVIKSK